MSRVVPVFSGEAEVTCRLDSHVKPGNGVTALYLPMLRVHFLIAAMEKADWEERRLFGERRLPAVYYLIAAGAWLDAGA